MPGFKKPSVVVREVEVKLRHKLGMHVPADPRCGYTDRMEFLGAGTLIAYKEQGAGYPTANMKAAVVAGANMARQVMRSATSAAAAVIMLRKKESPLFQQVMQTHFHLIAGDDAGGFLKDNVVDKKFSLRAIREKDRRWVIEKVREKFLSLSVHVNTGVYLVDVDAANRDLIAGAVAGPADLDADVEAYVASPTDAMDPATWRTTSWKGLATDMFSSFKNGQIHIAFAKVEHYTPLSYARLIIHEAAHRYLGVKDHAYAHEATYPTMSLTDSLDNADSIAWAAVSLHAGAVKMSAPGHNPDWDQCA
jgi:hypothetical protein